MYVRINWFGFMIKPTVSSFTRVVRPHPSMAMSTPSSCPLSSFTPLHHHRFLFLHPTRRHTRAASSFSSLSAKATKNNDDAPDPPERLFAAASYLYPFLDGVRYGKYVVAQFPPLQLLLQPLVPAIRLFNSFPLNGFLVFITLYFAVVRNPNSFSRYVRFNTMQAVVLDVLLIFPDLLERSFSPRDGMGLDVVMSIDSTVFLYLLVCLAYGSISCVLGQVPRLPLVADAADRQVL